MAYSGFEVELLLTAQVPLALSGGPVVSYTADCSRFQGSIAAPPGTACYAGTTSCSQNLRGHLLRIKPSLYFAGQNDLKALLARSKSATRTSSVLGMKAVQPSTHALYMMPLEGQQNATIWSRESRCCELGLAFAQPNITNKCNASMLICQLAMLQSGMQR